MLALVVALGALGCGARTASVSGQVSYKGTPLKGGNVTFLGADQKSVLSPISEDGRYTLDKVAVGPAKIGVETDSLAQIAKRPKYGPPAGASGDYKPPDPGDAKRRYVPIPKKYADPETSGLTVTVTAGKMNHNIDLPEAK